MAKAVCLGYAFPQLLCLNDNHLEKKVLGDRLLSNIIGMWLKVFYIGCGLNLDVCIFSHRMTTYVHVSLSCWYFFCYSHTVKTDKMTPV